MDEKGRILLGRMMALCSKREYCEADIKSILIGVRRHRLVSTLEQDLLEDAREKGRFVIY